MEGNQQIDILMIPVMQAIRKHVKDRDAQTEIYNRAYEAIQNSMRVNDLFYDCRSAASILGSIKTEKKSKASAENGKKGGRPRKLIQ